MQYNRNCVQIIQIPKVQIGQDVGLSVVPVRFMFLSYIHAFCGYLRPSRFRVLLKDHLIRTNNTAVGRQPGLPPGTRASVMSGTQ